MPAELPSGVQKLLQNNEKWAEDYKGFPTMEQLRAMAKSSGQGALIREHAPFVRRIAHENAPSTVRYGFDS